MTNSDVPAYNWASYDDVQDSDIPEFFDSARKVPSNKQSPSRSRRAVDGSRETAITLYRTYQEDIEHFVDYLQKRPNLDEHNNEKIRRIMLPHLCSMRDYFEEMNKLQRSPVDLQALKNLILWLYHFQKLVTEQKDLESCLRDDMSTVRAAIKTAANSMCVRAILPNICTPRPPKIAPLPMPRSTVRSYSASNSKGKDRYNWQYDN